MISQRQGRFRFGSNEGLPAEALTPLARALAKPTHRQSQPLDGRGGHHIVEVPALGSVFIKHYLRGGLIGRWVQRGHLWSPRSRSQREYEALVQAAVGGVRVPRALAWAVSGGPWVQCWLIMEQEMDARPYSAIIREDPGRAIDLLPAVVDQVVRLVQMRLLHVDLHPGNILLDAEAKPIVIDFDKARVTRLTPTDLVDRYTRRWSRAIAKHHLPAEVGSGFAERLVAAVSAQAS